jgi:hypothetical protein
MHELVETGTDMLDHVVRDDDVEELVVERQRCVLGPDKLEAPRDETGVSDVDTPDLALRTDDLG